MIHGYIYLFLFYSEPLYRSIGPNPLNPYILLIFLHSMVWVHFYPG